MSRVAVFTGLAAALSLCHLAYVWYSRSRPAFTPAVRRAAPPAPEPAGLRILQFYAMPGEVVRGERALVCYGVAGARAVRVDPPVEELGVSRNRCFALAPRRSGQYTLTAEGPGGEEARATLHLRVVPPAPYVEFIHISEQEVKRGAAVAFCYGVRNAVSARLEPSGMPLAPVKKRCLMLRPTATRKYAVVAHGEDGRVDRLECEIRVK